MILLLLAIQASANEDIKAWLDDVLLWPEAPTAKVALEAAFPGVWEVTPLPATVPERFTLHSRKRAAAAEADFEVREDWSRLGTRVHADFFGFPMADPKIWIGDWSGCPLPRWLTPSLQLDQTQDRLRLVRAGDEAPRRPPLDHAPAGHGRGFTTEVGGSRTRRALPQRE